MFFIIGGGGGEISSATFFKSSASCWQNVDISPFLGGGRQKLKFCLHLALIRSLFCIWKAEGLIFIRLSLVLVKSSRFSRTWTKWSREKSHK